MEEYAIIGRYGVHDWDVVYFYRTEEEARKDVVDFRKRGAGVQYQVVRILEG